MLARSGKVNDAVQLLLKNKGNEHNLDRILISGQVLLEKGDVSGAIKILEKLPNDTKYRAGLLSSLVALYLAADMRPKAAQLLKEAVSSRNHQNSDKENMKLVWRKTAEFHLQGTLGPNSLKNPVS